jgi:hypothetical protein
VSLGIIDLVSLKEKLFLEKFQYGYIIPDSMTFEAVGTRESTLVSIKVHICLFLAKCSKMLSILPSLSEKEEVYYFLSLLGY